MIKTTIIEHGKAKAFYLNKNDKIKILIPCGGQVTDIVFKGYNQAKTREEITYLRHKREKMKSEKRVITPMAKTLEAGECLFDGEGNPVLLLKENNVSEISVKEYAKQLPRYIEVNKLYLKGPKIKPTHDLLWPGCSSNVYKNTKLGCRELLSDVLNIEVKNLPPVCSLFMSLGLKDNIIPSPVQPGDNVVFEALEDVVLGITSCSDNGFCNLNPSEVIITHYKNGSAGI